jgi:hypothetical protein
MFIFCLVPIGDHCEFMTTRPERIQTLRVYWYIVCLFSFEMHEQFFSYLATVTFTGDRAANLDLCLALTAFSSEGTFTCHTYCDKGPSFLRSYPKDPWFYLLNAVLLAKEQPLPATTSYFKRLSFDAAGPSGARTHDLPFAKREHYH